MAEITPPTIWDFSTTTSGANSSGAGQPSAPLGLVEGSRPTLVQAPQPDPTSSLHPWNQASSYRHSISYPGHLDHAPEGAPIILYSAPSMLTSGLAHVIDNRSMEMQSTDISGDPTWPTVESPLEERNVAIPTAATNPTANHELYRIYSNHQQSESTLNAHISHQSWLQNSAGAFPMTLPPTSSSGLHSHQRLVQPHNNFEPHPIGSGKGYQSRYAFASSMTAKMAIIPPSPIDFLMSSQ
ncbi:hypothetical protein FRC20_004594 [Serendipita sp. 405]|nr:hypothetical protein FRC20_004594 [Serendipita sp. 405]